MFRIQFHGESGGGWHLLWKPIAAINYGLTRRRVMIQAQTCRQTSRSIV